MVLPVLLVLLAMYAYIAIRISRRVFPGSRRKAWAFSILGAMVIFGGDHLAGASYSYLWVRSVPRAAAVPIVADRVALEFDFKHRGDSGRSEIDLLGAYAMHMVDAPYWRSKGDQRSGLQASYAAVQVLVVTDAQPKVFDLRAVANADKTCDTFFKFDQKSQERWRGYASQGLENGQRASCLAITPALKLSADYLFRLHSRPGNVLEKFLGVEEMSAQSVSELPSGQVRAEERHVTFRGGWVQRTFWTSFSTGMTFSIHFASPGARPSIRPASKQGVI
jgi:hypothetical protein